MYSSTALQHKCSYKLLFANLDEYEYFTALMMMYSKCYTVEYCLHFLLYKKELHEFGKKNLSEKREEKKLIGGLARRHTERCPGHGESKFSGAPDNSKSS